MDTSSSDKGGLALRLVPTEIAPRVFNAQPIRELFAQHEWRAGGRFSTASIEDGLKSGENQLWLIVEGGEDVKAAIVTDIRPYPNGYRTCQILGLVGSAASAWLGLVEELEDWARRQGCAAIETIGRKGWARLLDWEEAGVLYEKKLR